MLTSFALVLAALFASPLDHGAVTVMAGPVTTFVFTEPMVITGRSDGDTSISRARERAYQATRARLAADDDGGTIYLDGPGCGRGERPECIVSGCEWLGPRLDGTTIKVCGGSVVAVALGPDVRSIGGAQ
jgi:hypothetical protein